MKKQFVLAFISLIVVFSNYGMENDGASACGCWKEVLKGRIVSHKCIACRMVKLRETLKDLKSEIDDDFDDECIRKETIKQLWNFRSTEKPSAKTERASLGNDFSRKNSSRMMKKRLSNFVIRGRNNPPIEEPKKECCNIL